MRRAFAPLLIAALSLAAQDLLPREVLMLARIRDRVRQAIDRLPDCTCTETVARFRKLPGKELKPVDTVAFQVLFSGGKELFGWPGDVRWETEPSRFVTGGMIGNGLFALHLRSIFLNNQSIIKFHGIEARAGHVEARYDFGISRMMSGYTLLHGSASGIMGMSGSFWADPETYEIRRVEFHGEDIPLELMVNEVSTSIDYQRVRVGSGDFLLPQTAELGTVDTDGEEDTDRIEFTHCQGFHTESSVNFGAADEKPAAAPAARLPAPPAEGALPPELRVTVALTAPFDDHAAVGSLVEGKVVGSVAQKGKMLLPAGTPVKGRIRRLEHYSEEGGYFILALEFMDIEMPDENLRFYAELQDIDRTNGAEMTLGDTQVQEGTAWKNAGLLPAPVPTWSKTTLVRISTRDVPGVGTFFVRGSHFQLPAGFKTVWKTQLFQRPASR
jgi:hypothetical protein